MTSMEDAIRDIQDRLRAGEFVDEVAVSLGIVWPILNALSWPVANGNVVRLSHSLSQGRRVDFALCHPPGQPMVFIEVKQAGRASAGERQLVSDAAQHGVPLAVLTTGREWRFCLPGDSDDDGDRCVAVLDLLAPELDETVARLQTYLGYRAVTSGEAVEAARADYREIARQRQIQRTLPEAWKQLIEEPDELLLELIAEKTESLCGYRPDQATVAAFLAARERAWAWASSPRPSAVRTSLAVPQAPLPISGPAQSSDLGGPGFLLTGEWFPAKTGSEILAGVLRELTRRDPDFPQRFEEVRDATSRGKRRYLARSREALYPGSEHLARKPSLSRELWPGAGWWVDVHLDSPRKEKVIQIACRAAGLRYGVDVKVRFPGK